MFDAKYNYENAFFISGQKLIGVDSIDLSYAHTSNVGKYIGFKSSSLEVSGPVQQKLAISQNLIYSGGLSSYTGDLILSGSINYGNNSYGFKTGYLDEFMVSCAIGSVPKVNTNFTIYDALKTGVNNASGVVAEPTIYVPNQGSISVTCDNSSTNRVVGFDFAAKVTRIPIYAIGSSTAKSVLTMPVIEYIASVQIEVDDAFLANSTGFLFAREDKTVIFTVKNKDRTITLQELSLPNASLVGENLSSSADGGVKLTLNYQGHS